MSNITDRRETSDLRDAEATHYVVNNGSWVGVKVADFFIGQGGLTEPWGKHWKPVQAETIGQARRMGAAMFGIELSHIYLGEK
jgi:glycerol uptake facilitator-like aquaporin